MQTLLYTFVGIGLASHFGRLHMMLRRPELYERFHAAELQLAKVQDAAGRRMAAEGKRAIGWLIRKARRG